MNYYVLLGIISGIVTIISLFIPEKWRTKKTFLAVTLIVVIFISGWITDMNSRLDRVKSVQKSAMVLMDRRNSEFTDKGFIQASLSFMEENKDLYPDSYQRAIQIQEGIKDKWYSGDISDAAYEMEGLIYGIAILNREKCND
ncbi:hypothetical protein [Bacteroides difficilis]|uniref:hypothetical protein n=1 Tax=Bacteroides difficilis TaxID=2763021 RepID=UPI003AB0706A